uniref:Uncharacterized protein n=1 Tax=Anopheles farauti TaxID=69004 RepID=A0A182QY88_9DIPT
MESHLVDFGRLRFVSCSTRRIAWNIFTKPLLIAFCGVVMAWFSSSTRAGSSASRSFGSSSTVASRSTTYAATFPTGGGKHTLSTIDDTSSATTHDRTIAETAQRRSASIAAPDGTTHRPRLAARIRHIG